ncbi:MAG: serine hydrolase domain-containing protein [Pseudomonadota bacterium]
MSEKITAVLDNAVAQGDVPFAVGLVGTADGISYQGAAGEAESGRPADADTVYRIFSMTKAVGSVAAMVMIDRGKFSMDTPVGDILPAFDDLQVCDGFDGDTPRMRPAKTRATIRHLATHCSGLEYEFWNADMPRYMEATGHPTILSGLKTALNYPLMTDPGTRWGYGPGIDWLGQCVEAVDGRRIDQFCREEIFEPLGMGSTGFELTADMSARLAGLKARGEDGAFAPFDLAPPSQPEVYGMGHALYSTPKDYLTFLRMVLNRGALGGARILSEDAVDAMLADQMEGREFLPMITCAPGVTDSFDPFQGIRKTHSFAFMRNEADVPGRRSAGSQSWAGVCNTHYWLDPSRGIAAVIMTQSLPFVEPRFMKTYDAYEQAVYASL